MNALCRSLLPVLEHAEAKFLIPARPALCHADALRFPLISRHSAESFFLAGLVFCSSLEHLVKLVVLGKLHCLFCRRLCKLRLAV